MDTSTHLSKRLLLATFTLVAFNILNSQVVQTFSYTGSAQTFVVPPCVNTMTMEAWGAQGGANWTSNTNFGGYARGVFTVTPGSTLTIYVGQQPNGVTGGFNGGGNGETAGQGGGGASDVRLGGVGLNNRILVAGGGGGAGYWSSLHVVGGVGGGFTGGDGYRDPNFATNPGGQGGAQTSSGLGTCVSLNNSAMAGGFGFGGSASGCGCEGYGGGGGWYGGAASGNCRGGGGGSGYIQAGATNTLFTSGVRVGHGQVVLSWFTNGSGVSVIPTSTAICNGTSINLTASGVLSYTWDGGSQAASIQVNPSTTTNYTVQGTNALGCISTAVITVSVDNTPSMTVTSTSYSICPGKTFTLNATGMTSYTWSGGAANGQSLSPSVTTSYSVTGGNACGTTNSVITITVTPLPVNAVANPSVICASTAATLTGTSPIPVNYTWSPGPITGSLAVVGPYNSTVYTVTASDGTCAGTSTVLVTTKPNPTVTLTNSISTICRGEIVNLSASGADSYTWSPGGGTGSSISVSPLTSTLYVATGENSVNCTAQVSHVVIVKATPNINAVANKTLVCSGAQVNLTATGAHTYTWDGGAQTASTSVNPNVTTTYSVSGTYTDTNCSSSETITVVVFIPTVTASSPGSICLGDTANLVVTGASTFTWDNGSQFPLSVTPTVTTIYNVNAITFTVPGVGCPSSDTTIVVVLPNPSVTAASTRTSICKGEKTILTAGGASTYSWSNSVTTATNQVSPTLQTVYTVKGTDDNGCDNTASITVRVNSCTGIEENGLLPFTDIFPNPNKGNFVIKSQGTTCSVSVVNSLGQVVRTAVLSSENAYQLEVKDLANGVYFVVSECNGQTYTQKVVVGE